MEPSELKRKIVNSAVERVLDAHQVPARHLLATLKRMEGIIADYQSLDSTSKKERDAHVKQLKTLGDGIDRLTSVIDAYETKLNTHAETVGDLLLEHKDSLRSVGEAVAYAKSLKQPKAVQNTNTPVDIGLIISQVTDALRGTLPQEAVFETKEEPDEESLYQKFIDRLQKERPIDISHLRNAESFMYKLNNGKKLEYKFEELMHGPGTGGASGGTAVYGEVVAGSGTAWTLSNTPTSGTLRLYANGQRLTLTVDYSLVGAAITTVTSWASGTLLADYSHT